MNPDECGVVTNGIAGQSRDKVQSSKAMLFNRKDGKDGKNSILLPDLPGLPVQLIGPI
jgi:hypothetical protein